MTTALTEIFGSEISVADDFRVGQRRYVGLPGADGLLSMWLGTRGYPIVITGQLWATGETYAAARNEVVAMINAIEPYLGALPASYSFQGVTYADVVFDSIHLLADSRGVTYHWTASGKCQVDFVCQARSLI